MTESLPLPGRLTVNGEQFVALGSVIEALAKVYALGTREASLVARLCDDHLDRRGAILGYVRDAASRVVVEGE